MPLIHTNRIYMRSEVIKYFVCVLLFTLIANGYTPGNDDVAVSFDGQYGQLEIGGKYVGAGFHHSFPLPGRISFYYPVANSIDLSSDYWYRGFESHLYSVLLDVDGITKAIGTEPWRYEWAPYYAVFSKEEEQYNATIEYRFAESLPIMIVRMRFENNSEEKSEFRLFSALSLSIRTSHTFALKDNAELYFSDNSSMVIGYPDSDTDSTAVFVVNAGEIPVNWSGSGIRTPDSDGVLIKQPRAMFEYKKRLAPGEVMEIIHIIGSSRINERQTVIRRAIDEWEENIDAYEQRVSSYALNSAFDIDQAEHVQTVRWSRALLETNLHHIDGEYVPMPCPAEYNFYFTHDMLLTNLGRVMFDVERVREDLLFLHSRTGTDNVLPHAYYWKDGVYQTEFAGTDNWNHLWFIILLNSYFLHSGDAELVSKLYPVADKSIRFILENYHDGLMYASQPDWWDIGNIYGAQAYLTILTIRAIESFSAITVNLGEDETIAHSYIEKSDRMKNELIEQLWDPESGFLLNMLDDNTIDRHFYSGSLLAAAFDIIGDEKKSVLLETARKELHDENLGIRNAMPADFHELTDLYQFKGTEAGGPYQYLNGGVWPHGNAWYALGLIAAGLPDEAELFVRRYMTLDGIMNSPRGQPSFFEYRNANSESVRYGEIDKPTFLWAGGWYLHVLYRLAGVRDNGWNISFDPRIPSIFGNIRYSVWNKGERTNVNISGAGKYFKQIKHDGEDAHSAILHSNVNELSLERGEPDSPYLAYSSSIVRNVEFDSNESSMLITCRGGNGQTARLSVVSPLAFLEITKGGENVLRKTITEDNGVYLIDVSVGFTQPESMIKLQFK